MINNKATLVPNCPDSELGKYFSSIEGMKVDPRDHIGMYYQKDGSFKKEKDENSVGLCIISNFRTDIIMSLKSKYLPYNDFIKEVDDLNTLPTYFELFVAFEKFKSRLNMHNNEEYWMRCFVEKDKCYIVNATPGVGSLAFTTNPGNWNFLHRHCKHYHKVIRLNKCEYETIWTKETAL